MKVVYGIQGPADLVLSHRLHRPEDFFLLTYDKPITSGSSTTIFAPLSTWTSGRNALMGSMQAFAPDAEYYCLMDHDAVFVSGDFDQFEANLASTRPSVGFPLMAKALQSPTLIPNAPHQRAIAIDEQFVAMHRSVVGIRGIAPLISEYDWASWYIACLVFEYLCITQFGPSCHQYNDIKVSNLDHVWETDQETAYTRGEMDYFLPLFQDVVRSICGHFDQTIIEQFDRSGDEAAARLRQRLASIMVSRDGAKVEVRPAET